MTLSVMMPFQVKSLDQIAAREVFLRLGMKKMLENGFVRSQFEISDEPLRNAMASVDTETKELARQIEEEKAKFEERVMELVKESRQRAFSAIDPDQRRRLIEALSIE